MERHTVTSMHHFNGLRMVCSLLVKLDFSSVCSNYPTLFETLIISMYSSFLMSEITDAIFHALHYANVGFLLIVSKKIQTQQPVISISI